ncbi:class I SAM-dependent methyltransferase [Cellulomonas sp.]|uniref:class I SAM-dependent methyltransferase n=1 Tax=Cellulomonas sp. TaxID=40001 RepID=UPI001B26681D|nr:class I SAM-dependent methyltransferase [Cellulomonas sp.]MBO9555478.1 class I SAM-dependent methyltransferase [Cellulomonas sp.]
MSVYDLESVDPDAANTSHALVLEQVGTGARVLDIGCSTGFLGEVLIERGCTVDGVEVDPDAAEIARKRGLRTVTVMDLDREDLAATLEGQQYDRIILADVLEHLMRPGAVLAAASTLLAPGGQIVISVPNVTHGSLRLALLQGRWDYRDTGLLDRTHIRFFTQESILALVEEAGLQVARLRSTIVDPLASEVELDRDALLPEIVEWVRSEPSSFDYQFILVVEKIAPGQVRRPSPALEQAVVLPEMVEAAENGRALLLEKAALAAEITSLRRKVLTMRDHAVGAEAELGTARRERAIMERKLAQAEHDVAELRASASWRVGQMVVAPMSKVRRAIRGSA